jgi:hypothetical protein
VVRRGRGRACCVVVPIGCLMSVTPILVFSGLTLARPQASSPASKLLGTVL